MQTLSLWPGFGHSTSKGLGTSFFTSPFGPFGFTSKDFCLDLDLSRCTLPPSFFPSFDPDDNLCSEYTRVTFGSVALGSASLCTQLQLAAPMATCPPKKPLWREVLGRIYILKCLFQVDCLQRNWSVISVIDIRICIILLYLYWFSARKLSWCMQFASYQDASESCTFQISISV